MVKKKAVVTKKKASPKSDPKVKPDVSQMITEFMEKLLDLMATNAKVKVTKTNDTDYLVDIKTDDEAGLLIGTHGETLNSIQSLVSIYVRQKTGEWVRITVDVADWREKQEEKLKDLADQAATRSVETGQPQQLYNLTPGQRRTIHLYLSEKKGIETFSEGEDTERYLVVKASK